MSIIKTIKKHEKKIITVMLIIFSLAILVSGFMIFMHFYQANKSAKSFEKLSELVMTAKPALPEADVHEPDENPEPEKELTAFEAYSQVYEKNNDFVGWIKIEGTALDYPVVQTPDSPDYYLRRGFDKEYSYYGVPYAAHYCDVKTSSNVIIFGHNMNNGSMFATLDKYKSYDFYKNHKIINFDTLEGFGRYEIVAVFKTVVYAQDEFKYFKFVDGDQKAFDDYIATCKQLSLYDTGVTAQYGDKLITLSTCEYSEKRGRFAVVAKKID